MRLTILMISSILLAGCNSTLQPQPRSPKVVTRYEVVQTDIPAELLRCAPAPDPAILKKIRFLKGKEAAKKYVKDLVLANYKNCQKIKAIKELTQ